MIIKEASCELEYPHLVVPVSPGIAVILVDMQPPYLCRLYRSERERLVTAQALLVKSATLLGVPVVFIEHRGMGGTDSVLIEVASASHSLRVVKEGFDGFEDTSLLETLHGLGIRQIIVAGLFARECVAKTVRSAIRFGFMVYSAVELIADVCWLDPNFSHDWYREHTIFGECSLVLR